MKSLWKRSSSADFLPDADEIEQRPHGKVASLTIRILALMILVFIVWACFSRTDQVVVARGKLVTSTPNIVLQPSETARVDAVLVREGQVVKGGEVLVTLDPTFAQADAAQVDTKLIELSAEQQRLKDELAGRELKPGEGEVGQLQSSLAHEKKANFDAQVERMEANIAQLKAEIDTNNNDIAIQESRVKSLSEIEAMDDKLLVQGMVPKLTVLERRERRQEAERGLIAARSKDQELKRQIGAAQAQLSGFRSEWRERTMQELVKVTADRDQTAELQRKAERRSQLISLTAPKDGIVLDITNRTVGSIVREAEPVLTLVPLGDVLEAEVEVHSEDVGFVKVGDPVMLKIDAFPFQKFGLLRGTVTTLSDDAFVTDVAGNADRLPSAYYRARIRIEPNRAGDLSADQRLLPGMNLAAELVVGSRSVMSYILYPVMKAVNEGVREP